MVECSHKCVIDLYSLFQTHHQMEPSEENIRAVFDHLERECRGQRAIEPISYSDVRPWAVPLVLGFWRGVGRHAYAYNIMDEGDLRIVIEVRNIDFTDRFENDHQLL